MEFIHSIIIAFLWMVIAIYSLTIVQGQTSFVPPPPPFPIVPVDPQLMAVHWKINAGVIAASTSTIDSPYSSTNASHRFITTPGLPLSLVSFTPCSSVGSCFGPSGPLCAQGYRISFWSDRSPSPSLGNELWNYAQWGANFCPPGGREGWSTWISEFFKKSTPSSWSGNDYYLQSIVDVRGDGKWQNIGDTIRFSVLADWCPVVSSSFPLASAHMLFDYAIAKFGYSVRGYAATQFAHCEAGFQPFNRNMQAATTGMFPISCQADRTWTTEVKCVPCATGFTSSSDSDWLCEENTDATVTVAPTTFEWNPFTSSSRAGMNSLPSYVVPLIATGAALALVAVAIAIIAYILHIRRKPVVEPCLTQVEGQVSTVIAQPLTLDEIAANNAWSPAKTVTLHIETS